MPSSRAKQQRFVCPSTQRQREIWMTAQMSEEANCAFNEALALRIGGHLAVDRLWAALSKAIQRQDALRASISPDGRQLIFGSSTLQLRSADLSMHPREEARRRFQRLCRREALQAFNLHRGPLLRAKLAKLPNQEHALVLVSHHLVCDRVGLERLVREVLALYSGSADLPDAPSMFAEATRAGSEEAEARARQSLAYWSKHLTGSLPFLEFPLDRPRPALKTWRAKGRLQMLDPQALRDARKLSQQSGADLNAILVAAFAAFCYRISGNRELLLGVPAPSAKGPRSLASTELLPLKLCVEGEQSFSSLLTQVQREMLAAARYPQLSISRLLKSLQAERDPSRPALMSVSFAVENEQGRRWQAAGLELAVDKLSVPFEQLDMGWLLRLGDRSGSIECRFNRDLWNSDTIEFRIGEFQTLLAAAVAAPERAVGRLALLPRAELSLYRRVSRGPRAMNRCMHLTQLLQLQNYANRPAVSCAGESVDYAELEIRSNQLANYLRHKGVKKNDLVGVFVERSVNMLVSLLACWKAGAAYVALDPGYPADRLLYMAKTAQLKALITAENLDKALASYHCPRVFLDRDSSRIAAQSAKAPTISGSADDTAYVIFTSGSTGKPKGVQITHGGVSNFLLTMAERPGLKADDRLLAVTTLSFDIAIMELCLPLLVGGRVIIAEREEALDGYRLLELIEQHRINVMQATPTTWRWMLAAGWQGQADFRALCGGEAFPLDLARQLLPCVAEVWNMYGPTEATVWSTCHRLQAPEDLESGPIAVGPPVHNTCCYVLDEKLQPVPVGVPGELFIGGDGVANGYLGMPAKTAERFIRNPLTGRGRVYRTGDQVRWRADGAFECLGRLDSQIKLRGYRIELGEIEAALARHPEVLECATSVVRYSDSDQRLVAYARCRADSQLNSTGMRQFLRGFLPDYMVPQMFVQLDALPLTPNGKVDRNKLPSPDPAQTAAEASSAARPRSATERELVRIWSELLKKDHEGVNELFFDVGGHSLLAMDMIARIEARFGVRIHVLDILVSTIEQLAAKIDAHPARKREDLPTEATVADAGSGEKPSFLKRWLARHAH